PVKEEHVAGARAEGDPSAVGAEIELRFIRVPESRSLGTQAGGPRRTDPDGACLRVERDRPALEARGPVVREQAVAGRGRGQGEAAEGRHGPEELVALAGGGQVPELHAVRADRGHEPSLERAPGADGNPMRYLAAVEGTTLAAGGHLPAVVQRLVVWGKVEL